MIKKAYDKKKGGGTYGRKKQTVISNFGLYLPGISAICIRIRSLLA